VTTDHELSGAHGNQLALGALAPMIGDRYRNVHSQAIMTVLSVVQRQRCWVTIRLDGRESEIPLEWIDRHWRKL
jgi:hypothetical protein